jgi:hypothetical protein
VKRSLLFVIPVALACARRPATQPLPSAPDTATAQRHGSTHEAHEPVGTATAAVVVRGSPSVPPSPQQMAQLPLADRMALAVVSMDEATVSHVRSQYAAGQRAGLHSNVFAKLGDSITESGSFLQDIGHGWHSLGSWTRLENVVRYFRARSFSSNSENNSFSRGSRAAAAGWTAGALLNTDTGAPAVDTELEQTHAAFALLMVGTNDAERSTVEQYRTRFEEVIQHVEARHVVLVLSTIPDHHGTPEAHAKALEINELIRRTAHEKHLPLLDYWAALQGLPHQGISDDNVHPSVYSVRDNVSACVFTDQALQFGYNVRNLTALLMFERLMQVLQLR